MPQTFGFVAGCHWGADNSWKIQHLDLSRASQGVLSNDNRFGYIQLPNHLTLAQAVTVDTEYLPEIEIAVTLKFDRTTGQQWDYYGDPPPVKKEWE